MSGTEGPDRLPAITDAEPVVDREQAGAALATYLEHLGLVPVRVCWVTDPEEGYLRAARGPRDHDGERRLREAEEDGGPGVGGYLIRAALWPRAWRSFEDQARQVAQEAVLRRTLHETLPTAWTAAGGAVRALGHRAAQASARSGPERVTHARSFARWAPLLEAYRAGLWLYWTLHQEVVAVPRPAMQTLDGTLHAWDGPAVAWPGGARYYFWRGIQVSECLATDPAALTAHRILEERNRELQRVMLERFGYDRFILELGAIPVQTDRFGALYRVPRLHRPPLVLVHVTNSTPEADGSRRRYFLRVPPGMKTAHEAVAWTFGMRAGEYRPTQET